MSAVNIAVTRRPHPGVKLFARLVAALGKLLLAGWDRLTNTPTEFGFVENPDKAQVDLILYCYDRSGYQLIPVGLKINRGGDTLSNYHTRALKRIVQKAAACHYNVQYIERSMSCACLWSAKQSY